jgi:hypothetical protein
MAWKVFISAAIFGLLLGIAATWLLVAPGSTIRQPPSDISSSSNAGNQNNSASTTNIYAHNLRLHQGDNFRVYVQWLRGHLVSVRKGATPSFDDPESFYLDVTNGVIRANIGDVCNYLNAKSKGSSLTDLKIAGTGDQVTITGNFHKGLTLPVELIGTLKPASNNRIQVQVTKINVLKIPFKAVLGGLHLTLSSMIRSGAIPGIEVDGDKLYLEANQLLPPPHIRGQITSVSIASPDLEAVYGDVTKDEERVGQWRNFLQLKNGTLAFGKLTMQKTDLMLIDVSSDPWFDLDLAHYEAQLVNGYTRMTPDQGLQIFMPDVSDIKADQVSRISIEWFKDRNVPPPAELIPAKH